MNQYPDAREQKRISNSDARTLLQNWVEERQVAHLDKVPASHLEQGKPGTQYFKSGHQGVLSTTLNERANPPGPNGKYTTYSNDFVETDTYDPNGEAKGIRYKLTEQKVRADLLHQMEQAEHLSNDYADEPISYVSETRGQHSVPGFVHRPPKATQKHDVYAEQSVSYWTEKRDKVHGTSQMKTLDSPFRRNDAFTKPVGETWAEAEPGELEHYPYMSQQTNNNASIN